MGTWVLDPDHTVAAFAIRHMMVAYVKGQFNKVTGIIQMGNNNREIVSIEAKIDASNIYTGIQKRDDHLRSPDFFNVEKYPEITFKSTKVNGNIEKGFRVTGDLSICGITHSVTSDVTVAGPVKAPFGKETTMGFSSVFTINREDFGITWNVPLESGGLMISKEVHIYIDAEADLLKE